MARKELLSYLEQQAGDNLRGVAEYDEEETKVLYLRRNIRHERLKTEVDEMVDRLRPESSKAETNAFPLGELKVTVRRFEDAIIMHFPGGESQGVVVALDPDVARNLNRFTSECLQLIRTE